METTQADFSNTFRQLSSEVPPSGEHFQAAELQDWHRRWQSHLSHEKQGAGLAYALMRSVNPAVVPRNHRIEEALSAAEHANNLSLVHRLLAMLASIFEIDSNSTLYQDPPPNDSQYRTFCGT